MGHLRASKTRQAAWVALGNLFSFMVAILSPMILSRFFNKADYGTYKQVMYVYNTLLVVFTFGLPKAYAYFIPKFDRKYSKDIINKITRILWVLGLIFALLLFFSSSIISRILGNPDLDIALKCFSPVPLFLLPTMGLDNICASFQQTKTLAVYTITTRIFTVICTILPVFIWCGSYLHAILGFDFACAITCLFAIYIKSRLTSNSLQENSSLTLKEILSFSGPLLAASMWGMVISSSTQFYIIRYYGNEVFADFSNGFMELPFVGMVIGAIATILLPAFSRIDRGEGISREALHLWTSSLIKSAKAIFPMLVYSIFFAKEVMTCLYGDQYLGSAYYFIIKNISGLFYIVPFAPVMLSIGKTKDYSLIHMIMAIVIVFLEYVTVKLSASPIIVAAVGEICNITKILLLTLLISRYARTKIKSLFDLSSLCKILFCSILAGIIAYIPIYYIELGKFVELLLSFCTFLVFYAIICKMLKVTYNEVITPILPPKLIFISKFLP